MNLPALPSTLLIWSEQAFVLAAAGAIAATAIAHPKARLLVWQGLLLLTLLLPVIEPWRQPPVEVAMTTATVSVTSVTAAAPARFHWRTEDWLWVLAAGAALRLIWVAAGFLRLRRYRKDARPLTESPLRFASDAAVWLVSDAVPSPVTYGWRCPVVLLPDRVLELPADLREAIQCHELIHVRRGDWLFVLGEALVRSLLWFHPAVWFVLGRIQLAREQVVDQEAVDLLQNRDRYLDALVAVAEYQLQPDLAPAPLFLRKRHLAARVEAVIKEVKMTRSKIVAGVTAVCSALTIGAFAVMWLFPFTSEAQTAPDSPGITVEAGAPLLHRAPVHRPEGFAAGGTVILQAKLDAKGEVSDTQVLSGPDELRKEALTSVLQWHYQPGPTLAQISIRFDPATQQPQPAALPGITFTTGGRGATEPGQAAPVRPAQPVSRQLRSIMVSEVNGMSPEARQELLNRLSVHAGDSLSQQDMLEVSRAVREFDTHLNATFVVRSDNELTLNITPTAPGQTGGGIGAPLRATSTPLAEGVYRPGNGVSNPIPTYKPEPQYTEEARAAKWQGSVTLSVVIDESGKPTNIKVLKPLGLGLDEKAIEAMSQWRFQPGMKNGVPVKIAAQVEITFRLL